jgi:hypothetical protein
LKKRLDAEGDPKRRAIIERLLVYEEALLLLDQHKLSGKMPFIVRSPDICGGPTPRLMPASVPSPKSTTSADADFDHRRCPDCERLMRLVYLQPHQLHRDNGYDVYHYRCESCLNTSRFVLDRNSDEHRPAAFLQTRHAVAKSAPAAGNASRSGKR